MAEKILTTEFSEEMQRSYLNYSMSVITARAIPDARDGLKPVQRRVLYDMGELRLGHDKPHRKSARIVGDTMGKYHPHGDSSIYETLVVLSQDFKKGMALVDGHGNFGSIEGDGAAAMRYTEARLRKFAEEVYLKDLDKTVNFVSNYDESEKEPEVLPVRVPNLLINGSEGIAVGMSTSIPPHNLGEVIDLVKAYIEKPDMSTQEMMTYLPGPDFPTGGIIANKSGLAEIYETGVGKIKLRGKMEVELGRRRTDKDKLIIREIPYTMIGRDQQVLDGCGRSGGEQEADGCGGYFQPVQQGRNPHCAGASAGCGCGEDSKHSLQKDKAGGYLWSQYAGDCQRKAGNFKPAWDFKKLSGFSV